MSVNYNDFIHKVKVGYYSHPRYTQGGHLNIDFDTFLMAFDGELIRLLDAIIDNHLPTSELRIEAIKTVRADLIAARMLARAFIQVRRGE